MSKLLYIHCFKSFTNKLVVYRVEVTETLKTYKAVDDCFPGGYTRWLKSDCFKLIQGGLRYYYASDTLDIDRFKQLLLEVYDGHINKTTQRLEDYKLKKHYITEATDIEVKER